MKNVIKWLVPLTVVLFISSCNGQKSNTHQHDDTQEHEEADVHHQQHDGMDMASVAKVVVNDKQLHAVFQHYVHLTTALTNSDMAEAKMASLAIETGLNEIMKGSNTAKIASQIAETNDLEKQRGLYATLSNDMISMVKKAGLKTGVLNVDYCPMANEDKGAYWMTASKEIRNPYMGSKMMTCGSIIETIE